MHPTELTPSQRQKAIASLFAQAILRKSKSPNRLAIPSQTRLSGDGSEDPKQTGRQSVQPPCRP